MNQTSPIQQQGSKPLRASVLREERLQQLMESCQQEVLKQIIGPFGLTSAMFDDKDGGNVTTTHNFKQGIVATENDKNMHDDWKRRTNMKWENRRDPYDKASKPIRDFNKSPDAPELVDGYTGKVLEKNKHAHFEHITPIREIEKDPGRNLRMTQDERIALANSSENTTYTADVINSKCAGGGIPAKDHKDLIDYYNSLTQEQKKKLDINPDLVKKEYLKSKKNIAKEDAKSWIKKDGKELLATGAEEAGRNAMRQAFGVLLHEFVNGSFIEIKVLVKDKHDEKNLIDRLIESLKRVMQRVIDKLKAALEALLQGGVQGFISNFLTFLINNLITTAKKFVTVIREGMQGLWQAIKLMLNPPKDMPSMEIARQVTKIIAGVVTTGLGMLMEESVKGFIASLPILVPIADILSAAITAIITGVVGALVVYGLDRIFDWLSSTGTELLQAYEANMEAQAGVVVHMQEWLELQFQNSRQYEVCAAEYQRVHKSYSIASFRLETATLDAGATINSHSSMIETVAIQLDRKKRLSDVLRSI